MNANSGGKMVYYAQRRAFPHVIPTRRLPCGLTDYSRKAFHKKTYYSLCQRTALKQKFMTINEKSGRPKKNVIATVI